MNDVRQREEDYMREEHEARLERERYAPQTDVLADFRGPDGVLGTDADYVERILDARAAAAEAVDEDDFTSTVEGAAAFERMRGEEAYDPADDRPTPDEL